MQTNYTRGWTRIQKKNAASRFEKYKARMVILVSRGKSGKNKSTRIYLTNKVLEVLGGKPEFIGFLRRSGSSNIGLEKVDSIADGFRVVYEVLGQPCTPYVSVNQIGKEYDLQSGAYPAHEDSNNVVVFDARDEPSVF